MSRCPPSQPPCLRPYRRPRQPSVYWPANVALPPVARLCSWTSREKRRRQQCLWNFLNILTKIHFIITPNSSLDSASIAVQASAILVTVRNQLWRIFDTEHGGTLSLMHRRLMFFGCTIGPLNTFLPMRTNEIYYRRWCCEVVNAMTLNGFETEETGNRICEDEYVSAGLNFAGRRGRASEAITDNLECPSIPASIQCTKYGIYASLWCNIAHHWFGTFHGRWKWRMAWLPIKYMLTGTERQLFLTEKWLMLRTNITDFRIQNSTFTIVNGVVDLLFRVSIVFP